MKTGQEQNKYGWQGDSGELTSVSVRSWFWMVASGLALGMSLWMLEAQAKSPSEADFNSIINENIQAERDLRDQMRKHLDSVDVKSLRRRNDFLATGKAVLGTPKAENVAVESSGNIVPRGVRGMTRAQLREREKRDNQRLTEELREQQ